MKFTAIAAAIALAAFSGKALAAPAVNLDLANYDAEASEIEAREAGEAGKTFFVRAYAPGSSKIDNRYLQAAYSYFYLTGDSIVEPCPLGSDDCIEGSTAFLKVVPEKNTAWLDVLKNGGQQIYIDKNGALRFSEDYDKKGSITKRFFFDNNSWTFKLNGKKKNFVACPVDIGMGTSMRVFVKTPGFKKQGCTSLSWTAIKFSTDDRPYYYPTSAV